MPRVAVGALVRDGRVLLCHRVPGKAHSPDRWDFPGGHLEEGESFGEALARELEEEVGVVVEPPTRSCDFEVRRGAGDAAGLVLRGWILTDWTGTPRLVDGEEHDDLAWCAAADLPGLALSHAEYVPMLRRVLAPDAHHRRPVTGHAGSADPAFGSHSGDASRVHR